MPQARIVIESTNAMLEISTKSPSWQPIREMNVVRENMRQIAAQMHVERQFARASAPGFAVDSDLSEDGQQNLQIAQGFFAGTMQGVQSINDMASQTLRFLGQRPDYASGNLPGHVLPVTAKSSAPRTVRSLASRTVAESGREMGRRLRNQPLNIEKMQRELRFIPGEVQIRMVRYPELKITLERSSPFEYGEQGELGHILNEAT